MDEASFVPVNIADTPTPEYLQVESFLQDALHARMLQTAFQVGLIDRLAEGNVVGRSELFRGLGFDDAGQDFMLQMLEAADVLKQTACSNSTNDVHLTQAFRGCLPFSDLLKTKLTFCDLVSQDFFQHLPQLLKSSDEFMSVAKLFEAFDYSRCLEVNMANCMHASRWMQLTTMLSRYEGPICCEHFRFSEHRRMLDVGGNSGEFCAQAVQRNPHLSATVLDLPVVCHVGQRHVASLGLCDRVQFLPGDMRQMVFPADRDLITWKSVLHDWPDQDAEQLVQKSFDALPAGGRIMIFERRLWDFRIDQASYGLLPVLLFFRSYRHPDTYLNWLHQSGFVQLRCMQIQLDVPFVMISGTKPGRLDGSVLGKN